MMTPAKQTFWNRNGNQIVLIVITVAVSTIVNGTINLTKEPFKEQREQKECINNIKQEMLLRPTYRDCNEIYLRKDAVEGMREDIKMIKDYLIKRK